MKKFIIFLIALFVTTFANAQIILEHTFEGWVTISANVYGDSYHYIQSPYYYVFEFPKNYPIVPEPSGTHQRFASKAGNKSTVKLYNTDDFSLYKAIDIEETTATSLSLVSRNILSTDNKICFCLTDYYEEQSYIYNEDGKLVATIKGVSPCIVKVNDKYMLILHGEQEDYTYIYSLPGNGETDVESVSSSPICSYSHKIARDGHILIETKTNTYSMQGQEVR